MYQTNTTITLMKTFYTIFFALILFSCGNDKSVVLPEIENAKITEILDVSPAYIFYNETLTDSVELNRKNLIGTTNWLFNIDKRLMLKQVIPKVKFLQDKKRNAQMHKNENAKNYFTCNDTSIQNLGFIEFTDVHYQNITIRDFFKNKGRDEKVSMVLNVISANDFSLELSYDEQLKTTLFSSIEEVINEIFTHYRTEEDIKLYLLFHDKLSFQEYITILSKIQSLKDDGISIDNNEFIY